MPLRVAPACDQRWRNHALAPRARGVIKQSQVCPREGLAQVLQGARIAGQDTLSRNAMPAFAHALSHAGQQLARVIDANDQQHAVRQAERLASAQFRAS